MTENETLKIAVHCLGVQAEQEVCEECPVYRESGIVCKEIARTAISALKEVQQYREIDTEIKKIFDGQLGLMDVLKEYIEDIKRTHNGGKPRKIIALSNEDVDKWESYKKIGTVEECREAVEKQKARKCVEDYYPDYIDYKCPSCGYVFMRIYKSDAAIGRIPKFCTKCGCTIEPN